MSHGNARLTVPRSAADRSTASAGGMPAHIAAAMGMSRRCVKKWVDRYAVEGVTGLHDRSSRPHRAAHARTSRGLIIEPPAGAAWPGLDRRRARAAARTVSGCWPGTGCRGCACLDPISGEVIRASKVTAVRLMKTWSICRSRSGAHLGELFLEQAGRVDTGVEGHRGVLLRVGCERSLEGSRGGRHRSKTTRSPGAVPTLPDATVVGSGLRPALLSSPGRVARPPARPIDRSAGRSVGATPYQAP